MGEGTRNSSLAQAPRSIWRQRSLQNGRQRFCGAKTLGPPQVGQRTMGAAGLGAAGSGAAGEEVFVMGVSGTQGDFEIRVFGAGLELAVGIGAHQPHRYQQAVAADLGHEVERGIDAQAQ